MLIIILSHYQQCTLPLLKPQFLCTLISSAHKTPILEEYRGYPLCFWFTYQAPVFTGFLRLASYSDFSSLMRHCIVKLYVIVRLYVKSEDFFPIFLFISLITDFQISSQSGITTVVHTDGFVDVSGCRTQQEPDQYSLVPIGNIVDKVSFLLLNVKLFSDIFKAIFLWRSYCVLTIQSPQRPKSPGRLFTGSPATNVSTNMVLKHLNEEKPLFKNQRPIRRNKISCALF